MVIKQPKVDPFACTDSVVKLFRHEAAAQAVLGKHPNVVEFLGIAEHADGSTGPSTQLPSIVLEYVRHGSLEGLLRGGDRDHVLRDDVTKLRLCRDIAAGLSNVHSAGITHNDVSARNVLVGDGYLVRGVIRGAPCLLLLSAPSPRPHDYPDVELCVRLWVGGCG